MDGEEVVDEDESMAEQPEDKDGEAPAADIGVVTFDDIMKGQDEQDDGQEDFVDIDKKTDEDEEQYYKKFVKEFRKKEQLDQIEKEKGLNFDEDDDEFIRGLQDAESGGGAASAQSYLEKEKRKSDKKNLKFLDQTQH